MDDDSRFHQHRNLNYDLNSTVMLAALISLCFVIIMVLVLYLYARCVLRHQARQEAALRIIISEEEPPPRTGLDASVVAALPVFTVAKQQKPSDDGNEMECSVCLSILEDGELGRTLPNCKHTFHAECVDKWFVSNSTCPICRAEAQRKDKVVIVVDAHEETPPDAGVLTQPSTPKAGGASVSRLSSFRRILSRDMSSKRLNQTQSNCEQLDVGVSDLERQ